MTKELPKIRFSTRVENQGATLHNDQCDCACAPCLAVAPLNFASSYYVTANINAFDLPNDWQGMFLPDGPTSVAALNKPATVLWSRFKSPQNIALLDLNKKETQAVRDLASAGLLISQESPDSIPIHHPQFYSAGHASLSAWLHLTDRCNLRCDYCYLPHIREDMKVETGYAALDATFRSAVKHGYKQVKLKYAGGEPLLRFDLIQQLQPYAQQLADHNEFELDAVVLSNGTLLTEEKIGVLQSLNLRLMLSLDGLGNWHDIQRHYANERGSFDIVSNSVDLSLKNGVIPHISITVSGRNAQGLPEIVDWVLAKKLPFSINFYRQNNFSRHHKDLELDEQRIIAGMMAAFAVIEKKLPEYSLLSALADRANLATPHVRTCSVGENYLIFNQQGKVSKCQMQMRQPITDISSLDPLLVIRTDRDGLQNIPVNEKATCRSCEWKYWCAGGCPLETYHAHGRYDRHSPNCNIYKAIFPQILRLEGLRLIKDTLKN
jgi:uncharacterized protein